MTIDELIVKVLGEIIAGVMKAQEQGIACEYPKEVMFDVMVEEGQYVSFHIPLNRIWYDDGKKTAVTYSYGSAAKN